MEYIWKLTHLNGDEFLYLSDEIAEIMDRETDIGVQNRFDLTIIFMDEEIPEDEREWLEFLESATLQEYNEEEVNVSR